jgi:hypothetical protein
MSTPVAKQTNQFYPSIKGKIDFSYTLAPVKEFKFTDAPKQGIIAQDIDSSGGNKQYCRIQNLPAFLQVIYDAQKDAHLYEVLTGEHPIYPYIDADWETAEYPDELAVVAAIVNLMKQSLLKVDVELQAISIFTASGPSPKYTSGHKSSFHIIFQTSTVFASTADLKCFMESVLYPLAISNKETVHLSRIIDNAVYSKNQTFRLPYQSKLAASGRPLVPWTPPEGLIQIPIEPELLLIGLYGEEKPLINLPQPLSKPSREQGSHPDQTQHPGIFTLIVALSNLLTPTFFDDFAQTRDFIWTCYALEQSDRMRTHIHERCASAQNPRKYCPKWVDSIIYYWDPGRQGHTIATLFYWASLHDPEAVRLLRQTHNIKYKQELFEITMEPDAQIVYSEPYVRVLPLKEYDTIILGSHLGTGKTTQIKAAIRYLDPKARILIVSARKSFTHHIYGELAADGFQSYMHVWRSLAAVPRLIIQVESLWKLGSGFQGYDLVILDEAESILNQFHSIQTNGDNLICNHEIFERCVTGARALIAADAFLSDRTFALIAALRNPRNTVYIQNTWQPYKRQAIRLRGLERDRRCANLGGFRERIVDALKAGKKIVVIWTSKRRGHEFVENVLKKWTDGPTPTYKFYSSDSTAEEQETLTNVAAHWAPVQCLMMTTSITIGINYDMKDAAVQFDEAFLYATSASALPRDIAQSLLRVRLLKDDKLTYVIDTRVGGSAEGRGLTAVSYLLQSKEDKLLKDHPFVRWTSAPKWAEINHVFNENEERVSRGEYEDVLHEYLTRSGYTLSEEVHIPSEQLAMAMETEVSNNDWTSIDDINDSVAATIEVDIKRGKATVEDRFAFKKWLFRRQFVGDTNDESLKSWWLKFFVEGKEAAFWRIVHEKRWSIERLAEDEAYKRYALMVSTEVEKRKTLVQFLELLGMSHSQEEKIFNPSDLEELGPKLSAVEKEIREGMGLRAGRRKAEEWKTGNTIDLIKVVLEAWGECNTLTEVKQKRRNGEIIREYTLNVNSNNLL